MAATDLNTVRATIESRLATELASSPVVPVVFSNMPFDSKSQDSFVQCEVSFGSGNFISQGDQTDGNNSVVGLVVANV